MKKNNAVNKEQQYTQLHDEIYGILWDYIDYERKLLTGETTTHHWPGYVFHLENSDEERHFYLEDLDEEHQKNKHSSNPLSELSQELRKIVATPIDPLSSSPLNSNALDNKKKQLNKIAIELHVLETKKNLSRKAEKNFTRETIKQMQSIEDRIKKYRFSKELLFIFKCLTYLLSLIYRISPRAGNFIAGKTSLPQGMFRKLPSIDTPESIKSELDSIYNTMDTHLLLNLTSQQDMVALNVEYLDKISKDLDKCEAELNDFSDLYEKIRNGYCKIQEYYHKNDKLTLEEIEAFKQEANIIRIENRELYDSVLDFLQLWCAMPGSDHAFIKETIDGLQEPCNVLMDKCHLFKKYVTETIKLLQQTHTNEKKIPIETAIKLEKACREFILTVRPRDRLNDNGSLWWFPSSGHLEEYIELKNCLNFYTGSNTALFLKLRLIEVYSKLDSLPPLLNINDSLTVIENKPRS